MPQAAAPPRPRVFCKRSELSGGGTASMPVREAMEQGAFRGTNSSNPASSSAESGANLTFRSCCETSRRSLRAPCQVVEDQKPGLHPEGGQGRSVQRTPAQRRYGYGSGARVLGLISTAAFSGNRRDRTDRRRVDRPSARFRVQGGMAATPAERLGRPTWLGGFSTPISLRRSSRPRDNRERTVPTGIERTAAVPS